jgi:hypothetical protein
MIVTAVNEGREVFNKGWGEDILERGIKGQLAT